jgi:hypothetical protein
MPAFLTTIPLPPPASPTHVEPFATPPATHLNQKQNKMASDPCKQSEAMIKIKYLVELPTVCGALPEGPKVHSSGFPFLPLQKRHHNNCQRNQKKNQPSLSPEGKGWVKHPEQFIGGSILVSKAGSS